MSSSLIGINSKAALRSGSMRTMSKGTSKVGAFGNTARRGFSTHAKQFFKGNGMYTAHKERLFKLQNGYFLIYYHRQAWYTIALLFARFTVPLIALAYLIKKNPFYRTYPIMLPIMIATFAFVFARMVKYSKRTNNMVHQILVDQTGTELTFVFKNQTTRRLRSD